jgi:hypothetical protein
MVASGHVLGCNTCIAAILANLGVGKGSVVDGVALNVGLEHAVLVHVHHVHCAFTMGHLLHRFHALKWVQTMSIGTIFVFWVHIMLLSYAS